MAERQLTNPKGASSMSTLVTDYRTGKDASGNDLPGPQVVEYFEANAAIAVNDLVSLVVPTATVPVRVKTAAVADVSYLKIGVALKAATAAGQVIPVCTSGTCRVNVGTGTPAAGDFGIPDTATAGEVEVVAAASAPAATTVVGTVLGAFLGTKDAANRAYFYFDRK